MTFSEREVVRQDIFPPTYAVIEFSSRIKAETAQWIVDKITKDKKKGGAELLLRAQPFNPDYVCMTTLHFNMHSYWLTSGPTVFLRNVSIAIANNFHNVSSDDGLVKRSLSYHRLRFISASQNRTSKLAG